MPKGKIIRDTFEQLAELGVSSAKKTVKSVKQTAAPSSLYNEIIGAPTEEEAAQTKREMEQKKGQYTPLKMEELIKKHDEQDKVKQQELRARLFQLVREGEKKAIGERKEEEQRRMQGAIQEEQEKKKQEEEKKKSEHAGEIPQGKIRRSIFSPKKAAARQQNMETRASSGKQ